MLWTRTGLLILTLALLSACGTRSQAAHIIRPELLNRDFTAPLDSGWQRETRNYDGSAEIRLLPDGGVTLLKNMCGWARLSQSVELGDIRKVFRTRARFSTRSSRPDYQARSGLALVYLDSTGAELGETRWYLASGGRNPQNGPNRRFVPVPGTGDWLDLELDIADELRRNLPGIKPADVRALRIAFEAFGSGTGGC